MLLLIRFPCGPTSFFLSETPSPIRSEAVSRTLTHALASNAAHSALPVDMSLLFRNHDRKKRLRLDREHDVSRICDEERLEAKKSKIFFELHGECGEAGCTVVSCGI